MRQVFQFTLMTVMGLLALGLAAMALLTYQRSVDADRDRFLIQQESRQQFLAECAKTLPPLACASIWQGSTLNLMVAPQAPKQSSGPAPLKPGEREA